MRFKIVSIVGLLVLMFLVLEPSAFPALAQGGVFSEAESQITEIARQAWTFLITLIVIVAMLGGGYYVLQGTAGAAFGGSRMTAAAIIGGIGIILAVLVVFFLLPELGRILNSAKPQPPF